ncbi:MAG: TadE/TadG family type IV pilus assembly protein [Mycobacteriales bacterium]
MRRLQLSRLRRLRHGELGAAIPEFLMVSVVLIFLVMLIMQAVLYLYIRSIVVASASEGARFGANANSSPYDGAEVANRLIARATSESVSDRVRCEGSEQPGEGGATLIRVRCAGDLPLFFVPLGDALPINVRQQSTKEEPR